MRTALICLAGTLVLLITGCGSGARCDATTCNGCCQGSVCETGTGDIACGSGGAVCNACSAVQVCLPTQSCGIDPVSNWKVQPASATVKNTNNGAQWDTDGSAPDPKVDLYCPAPSSGVTSSTEVSMNSFAPTWTSGGCVMQAKDLIASGFAYQVLDDDVIGADSITTRTTVVVTSADLVSGKATIAPADGISALSISLIKQ